MAVCRRQRATLHWVTNVIRRRLHRSAPMSPPRKPSKVFLVPQVVEDDPGDETALYVCEPIKKSVAKRSALLSGLLETSGVVQIPEGITFNDFRVWAKAGQAVKLSDRDLATVVRVRRSPPPSHAPSRDSTLPLTCFSHTVLFRQT